MRLGSPRIAEGTLARIDSHIVGSAAMSVFANFAAVTNVSFNLVTDLSQADFVMTKSAVNDYAGIFLAGEREITIDGVTQTVDGVGKLAIDTEYPFGDDATFTATAPSSDLRHRHSPTPRL